MAKINSQIFNLDFIIFCFGRKFFAFGISQFYNNHFCKKLFELNYSLERKHIRICRILIFEIIVNFVTKW